MSTPLIFAIGSASDEKEPLPEGRALSLRGRLWQSRACNASCVAMKRLLASMLAALAVPADAVTGGEIGTLPKGDYICELPGDVVGPVGNHVPDEDFSVINASSYQARGQNGNYLLVGEDLTMTSGPHRGKRYHRLSRGFLRQVGPGGGDGNLRCVRRIRNNQ
jgi:hypothetical protein